MIYKKFKGKQRFQTVQFELKHLEHYTDILYHDNGRTEHLQQLVDTYFNILGEKCQQVLKLFYYDEMTLKEIQTYLKYDNYNVVKSQKSRCLKTLKDLINKHKRLFSSHLINVFFIL